MVKLYNKEAEEIVELLDRMRCQIDSDIRKYKEKYSDDTRLAGMPLMHCNGLESISQYARAYVEVLKQKLKSQKKENV